MKNKIKELKELQDFAIWMTGCGYDFTQHEHFLKNKHLLTDESINYTNCCKELKDKEESTFEKYAKLQGYTRIGNSSVYKKEKGVYKNIEVFKKEYNKYLNL
tara:strand:- start:614 stop:919 length:306 start_codon:yes stop_codon:yes gene_type:complete